MTCHFDVSSFSSCSKIVLEFDVEWGLQQHSRHNKNTLSTTCLSILSAEKRIKGIWCVRDRARDCGIIKELPNAEPEDSNRV